MFKIPKVEKGSFYIDNAMKAMQEYAQKERTNIDNRFDKNKVTSRSLQKPLEETKMNKRKDLELQKIRFLNERVNYSLKKIISQFPKLKKIDPIYIKLINTSDIKLADMEDSLKRMLWITNAIDELTQTTEVKIKKTKSQETTGFLMKKYLGKVNSYFRKNKDVFTNLDEARKFMNRLPVFEPIYTASIAGFPNVGKSTLMNKMTGSNVEIQNYPFTTKGLMFGYIKKNETKIIQLIDTPGLLGRLKQNDIEKRAQIIITEHCDLIIFVLDFTLNCGFEIEKQLKLLKETKQSGKEIILYLSKNDIFDKDAKELKEENLNTIKKYQIFDNAETLKKYLLQKQTENKKFDIKNIKVIK